MKNSDSEQYQKKLDKKVADIEKQEKSAENAEFRNKPYRAVMISVTASLCLVIAVGGIVLTKGVFSGDPDIPRPTTSGESAESTANETTPYNVESFSTDPIFNSTPSSRISAADGNIVEAPVPMTTAAPGETAGSVQTAEPDEPAERDEPSGNGQHDNTSRPAASTAVSVPERGYDGNMLFG